MSQHVVWSCNSTALLSLQGAGMCQSSSATQRSLNSHTAGANQGNRPRTTRRRPGPADWQMGRKIVSDVEESQTLSFVPQHTELGTLSPGPTSLEEALEVLDLLHGAHEEGHPLVHLRGVHLHHAATAGGALAASLRRSVARGVTWCMLIRGSGEGMLVCTGVQGFLRQASGFAQAPRPIALEKQA